VTESISSSKSVRENARGHDLAIAISRIIEETRGKDIRILDLRSVTEVFDYFVIATGSSRRQMHAVSDEIERFVKAEWGDEKRGIEGYDESRWIVIAPLGSNTKRSISSETACIWRRLDPVAMTK
jgi:ribosome-associated protein